LAKATVAVTAKAVPRKMAAASAIFLLREHCLFLLMVMFAAVCDAKRSGAIATLEETVKFFEYSWRSHAIVSIYFLNQDIVKRRTEIFAHCGTSHTLIGFQSAPAEVMGSCNRSPVKQTGLLFSSKLRCFRAILVVPDWLPITSRQSNRRKLQAGKN
jgi:hypothetical protein